MVGNGLGSVPLVRPLSHVATTWGPYYDTLHPPGTVHMMTAWKVVPPELWGMGQDSAPAGGSSRQLPYIRGHRPSPTRHRTVRHRRALARLAVDRGCLGDG